MEALPNCERDGPSLSEDGDERPARDGNYFNGQQPFERPQERQPLVRDFACVSASLQFPSAFFPQTKEARGHASTSAPPTAPRWSTRPGSSSPPRWPASASSFSSSSGRFAVAEREVEQRTRGRSQPQEIFQLAQRFGAPISAHNARVESACCSYYVHVGSQGLPPNVGDQLRRYGKTGRSVAPCVRRYLPEQHFLRFVRKSSLADSTSNVQFVRGCLCPRIATSPEEHTSSGWIQTFVLLR